MIYRIDWDTPAINSAAGFLKNDPGGLQQVMDAIDRLAHDPRPENTFAYGSENLRRMRVGMYRVFYEISDATVTIIVLHLGHTA
ncbi:type II toxin-antitoxin system RelE family toxin [Streptomyces sp. 6N223]|uniref:type II toxin-antitoxin system RelE family toxin n=1 Tax=Streptomyces sp. 6N223 TaxID=3457412 RepID=UPI003FD3C467